MRSKERPKMILSDVKKLKVNDSTYLVKNRKSWYEQVQKNEPPEGLYFQYKDDTVSSSHFLPLQCGLISYCSQGSSSSKFIAVSDLICLFRRRVIVVLDHTVRHIHSIGPPERVISPSPRLLPAQHRHL